MGRTDEHRPGRVGKGPRMATTAKRIEDAERKLEQRIGAMTIEQRIDLVRTHLNTRAQLASVDRVLVRVKALDSIEAQLTPDEFDRLLDELEVAD